MFRNIWMREILKSLQPRPFLPKFLWGVINENVLGLDSDQTLCSIHLLSLGHCQNLRIDPVTEDGANKAMCITIGNAIAHYVPEDCRMTKKEAENYVKNSIWAFMHLRYKNDKWTWITDDIYKKATEENGVLYSYRDIIPATLQWPEFTNSDFTFAAAVAVIRFCMSKPSHALLSVPVTVFISTYIGLGKKGNITDGTMNKINYAMEEEKKFALNITPQLIKLVYECFGKYLNQDNARNIFETWEGPVKGKSLERLVNLSKISNSGLTSIVLVKTAIVTFPNFPWWKVELFSHQEILAAKKALETINNNPYYGFAPNLADISSRRYKSLAYLARELLVKYGDSKYKRLLGARGWLCDPNHKVTLDKLISNFNPHSSPMEREAVMVESEALAGLRGKSLESTELVLM